MAVVSPCREMSG